MGQTVQNSFLTKLAILVAIMLSSCSESEPPQKREYAPIQVPKHSQPIPPAVSAATSVSAAPMRTTPTRRSEPQHLKGSEISAIMARQRLVAASSIAGEKIEYASGGRLHVNDGSGGYDGGTWYVSGDRLCTEPQTLYYRSQSCSYLYRNGGHYRTRGGKILRPM